MFKRLIQQVAIVLLVALPCFAQTQPSEIGTRTLHNVSSNTDPVTFSHTVPSGTDLLVLWAHFEAGEDPTGTQTFGSDSFTLERQTTRSNNNADMATAMYFITDPTVQTATITVDFTSNINPGAFIAVNYQDVDTASPIGASLGVWNDSATSTTVFGSLGGGATDLLVASAAIQGADGDPISNDDSWTEDWETQTGGSSSGDFAYYGIHKTSSSTGVTITWSATDENSGIAARLTGATASTTPEIIWVSEAKTLNIPTPDQSDSGKYSLVFGGQEAGSLIDWIACTILETGEVQVQLKEHSEANPHGPGTNILASPLICDSGWTTSCNATGCDVNTIIGQSRSVGPRNPVVLDIVDVLGSPSMLNLHVGYR